MLHSPRSLYTCKPRGSPMTSVNGLESRASQASSPRLVIPHMFVNVVSTTNAMP
jgi:hypothetical protein